MRALLVFIPALLFSPNSEHPPLGDGARPSPPIRLNKPTEALIKKRVATRAAVALGLLLGIAPSKAKALLLLYDLKT